MFLRSVSVGLAITSSYVLAQRPRSVTLPANTTIANTTSASNETLTSTNTTSLRGSNKLTTVPISIGGQQGDKAASGLYNDFYVTGGDPNRVRAAGNGATFTISQYSQAVGVVSKQRYSGGRFEFQVKTGAVMPGVITALYLVSGSNTRTNDVNKGDEDEIDWEFLGKDPYSAQSNVILAGQEENQMSGLGFNSADGVHSYAIDWQPNSVTFFVDGSARRTTQLPRPLKPLQVHFTIWTTTNGWPGLRQWAGDTNWGANGDKSIEAYFEASALGTPA